MHLVTHVKQAAAPRVRQILQVLGVQAASRSGTETCIEITANAVRSTCRRGTIRSSLEALAQWIIERLVRVKLQRDRYTLRMKEISADSAHGFLVNLSANRHRSAVVLLLTVVVANEAHAHLLIVPEAGLDGVLIFDLNAIVDGQIDLDVYV